MRFRSSLIPTIKEVPADATNASHKYLLRAGYVRRVGAGVYSYLPLGLRVLHKIADIVRSEMDRAGALEVLLPALLPADYFKETGRWELFGDNLFRLKDRKGSDFHLGPTHEEIITDLARREIHSYRDMPRNLYQIQSKYRDEPRPRGGLLRCREFLMKDAYSFDTSEATAQQSYEAMRQAYTRIYDRLGLDYRMVSADSGAMGGSGSAEFQVLVQSGEDFLAACENCDYAANLEVAVGKPKTPSGGSTEASIERVETPKQRTIAEVSAFLKTEPQSFLKSLLVVADGKIHMVVLRGDHELNEIKLARALKASEVRMATDEEVREATGAAVGFAGPVGFKGALIIDPAARDVGDAVTGANETGYHLRHVVYGRDFEANVADVRSVQDEDLCATCGGQLKVYRGIEAGHIFLLGTHYSQKMNATFLDDKGESHPIVMGCYGIGVSRLMAAAIEQHHDDNGILWPQSIAPYPVHIVQLGQEDEVQACVADLEQQLTEAGLEPLIDDREERPGVKFKDADLIGIPWRITVGARALGQQSVELKARSEPNPKNAELVRVDAIVERLKTAVG